MRNNKPACELSQPSMKHALLLLPLLLAACGGSGAHRASAPSFSVHSYGRGAQRTWVFAPTAPPRLIVLFVHANPDGNDLVADWYMRNPVPTERTLNGLPRAYQHYIGHENNRDFLASTQMDQSAARAGYG